MNLLKEVNRTNDIEVIAYLIRRELDKAKKDPNYEGSEVETDNAFKIGEYFEEFFGYDWEQDEDASNYFAKATWEEIQKYCLEVIIPKIVAGTEAKS